MNFLEHLKPENNQIEMCITCPQRTGGALSKLAARVALGPFYKACDRGPFIGGETVHVQHFQGPPFTYDYSGQSFNAVIRKSVTMECGKSPFPSDMATSVTEYNGQITSVYNLQSGEQIWPVKPAINVVDQ